MMRRTTVSGALINKNQVNFYFAHKINALNRFAGLKLALAKRPVPVLF
jgi:hypothetical protein